MCKTILITGNGFDLYHGWPTKYTDFIDFCSQWYWFKEKYNMYKKGNSKGIKVIINSYDYKKQCESKCELIQFLVNILSKDIQNYSSTHIDDFEKNIGNNFWINHFKDRYKTLGKGWIDFEQEIENVLSEIELFFDCKINNDKSDPDYVSYIDKILTYLLNDEEIDERSYKELKRFRELLFKGNKFTVKYLEHYKLILLENLKRELGKLNRCVYLFLKEFVKKKPINKYSPQVNELKNVYLLNFNYTDTYCEVYGQNNLIDYHSVHGELMKNNLVLGISDDSFKHLDYVYFQKYFQRIQNKTGNKYKKWIANNEPVKVYIFGHSLDKTDKGILEEIFRSSNVESLSIYYRNQLSYESQVINLIDMFDKDFVIEQIASERIRFIELEEAVASDN